jgi:hypothetical protein
VKRAPGTLAVLALVVLGVGGCEEPAPLGLLEVRWTIAGQADAEGCESTGSDALGLRLGDGDGRESFRQRFACEEFVTLIDTVPAGTYTARAALLSSDGELTTDEQEKSGLVLREDTWTRISFAF